MRKIRNGALSLLLAVPLAPANASAQASVFPRASEAGAQEKYVLRVSNAKDVATTRVEVRFPRSARVTSFADVPGWSLEVIGDSAKHVIGAAWTGSLAPQRFVEFPFVAVNPKSSVRLIWPVYQTFSSGERLDWTGREDAMFPAPMTLIRVTPARAPGVTLALWVCIGALVLSIGGLIFALRPDSSAGRFHPGS